MKKENTNLPLNTNMGSEFDYQNPQFELAEDGEFITVFGITEKAARADYEASKEPLETETFIDWCKNSYEYEDSNPTEDNHKPLWKVLNEQRTAGPWKHFERYEGENICSMTSLNNAVVLEIIGNIPSEGDITEKQAKANAAYTALAVNNLHHLAEALQECVRYLNAMGENESICDTYKQAKEALNRIS